MTIREEIYGSKWYPWYQDVLGSILNISKVMNEPVGHKMAGEGETKFTGYNLWIGDKDRFLLFW